MANRIQTTPTTLDYYSANIGAPIFGTVIGSSFVTFVFISEREDHLLSLLFFLFAAICYLYAVMAFEIAAVRFDIATRTITIKKRRILKSKAMLFRLDDLKAIRGETRRQPKGGAVYRVCLNISGKWIPLSIFPEGKFSGTDASSIFAWLYQHGEKISLEYA